MRNNKIVNAIIAFCIAVALAAGGCCLGFASRGGDGKWFGNFKDISGWHWADKADTSLDPEKPNNGGNVIVTPDNDEGLIQLASAPLMAMSEDGIERAVSDSYVITATVDSSESLLQNITWSYGFENSSSEWASGKNVNDYVEFTVSSNTKQLTVKSKQAFGEPILIIAKATVDLNISASCKVDYIKRISSVDFSVNQFNLFELGKGNRFELIPEFTVGTVSGDLTVISISARLSDNLFRSYSNVLDSYSAYGYIQPWSYTFTPSISVNPFHFLNTPYGGGGYAEISESNVGKLCYNEMLLGAVVTSDTPTSDYLVMSVKYTYQFNNSEVQNGETASKDIKYSKGDLTEFNVVTKVDLDETHLYL